MTDPPFVVEPQRRVPVAAEVDVAVAGSGISGMFAALRCGRAGLRTLLIDRLGAPGGNMGPGMVVGGSFAGEAGVTLIGGLHGIPGSCWSGWRPAAWTRSASTRSRPASTMPRTCCWSPRWRPR